MIGMRIVDQATATCGLLKRVRQLCAQATVLLACMVPFYCALAMANEVVATRQMVLPHPRSGETDIIKKVIDRKTGRVWVESESGHIRSYEHLSNRVAQEQDAKHQTYGSLSEELKTIVDHLGDRNDITVMVHVRTPSVKYLNKMEHHIEVLRDYSNALLEIQPLVSLDDITQTYGIEKEHVLNRHAFITTVSKAQLKRMMFDEMIVSIEPLIDYEPLVLVDFTTFAVSSFNPDPLPSDARGQRGSRGDFREGHLAASL